MNATCPRCGTVSLVSAQAKHFTCKTCRLRFCHECRYWQVERRQSYCANCGAAFSIPPSAMPPGLLSAILYLPLTAIFLIPFIRSQLWHVVLLVILLPLIYAAAYLAVFYRHTGLTQATRREVILLARRTLTVATVVYIVLTLGDQTALIAALAVTVALVLVGLVIRRADANAIQELQAHRHTWAGILSMSSRDALLMRIPDTRLHKAR